MEALETIAKRLQGIPGRKKLVWLSANFPASTTDIRSHNSQQTIEHQDFGGEIAKAIRALNDANVAVYPIDRRDPYNAGLGAEGIDTANLFANGTGGKAFYSLTDLADAIRQSVNDTEVTYTLSFYPSDLKSDGLFHKVQVEVAHKGAEVRARKGYVAPDPKPFSEKDAERSAEQVLASPVNATGPGISVRFAPGAKKPNSLRDRIKLTLTDARLRQVLTAGQYTIRRFDRAFVEEAGDVGVALEDTVTGAVGSVQLHVSP